MSIDGKSNCTTVVSRLGSKIKPSCSSVLYMLRTAGLNVKLWRHTQVPLHTATNVATGVSLLLPQVWHQHAHFGNIMLGNLAAICTSFWQISVFFLYSRWNRFLQQNRRWYEVNRKGNKLFNNQQPNAALWWLEKLYLKSVHTSHLLLNIPFKECANC